MRTLSGLPLVVLAAACGGGSINLDDGPSNRCPAARADVTTLSWSDAALGASVEQVLVVTNNCTANSGDLIVSATVDGDPSFIADEQEVVLGPGASAEIAVQALVVDYAPHAATLVLTTNDEGAPTLQVALDALADPDQDGDGVNAVAAGGADCNDLDASARPGAAEVWYDGIDQDCDGASDFDQDGDGFDRSPEGVDCDDLDPGINPSAGERDNLSDDDCDGLVDEDFLRPGDVIITEVMADPVVVFDTSGEWFEVYNSSPRSLDLIGWTVSDQGAASFVVGDHLVVPPGGYGVLGVEGDRALNGGVRVDVVYPRDQLPLGNERGVISLAAGGNVVGLLEYEASWARQAGASLSLDRQFVRRETATLGAYWCASTSLLSGGDQGTPGAPNDLCTSVDHDGDGVSIDAGDCDDNNGAVYPGALEVWDGSDSDCNGVVDDALLSDLESGWVEGETNQLLSATASLGRADFDGDGKPELLVGSARSSFYNGVMYVLEAEDADTWADTISDVDKAKVEVSYTYSALGNLGLDQGDVDGDGVIDLVLSGQSSFITTTSPAVALFPASALRGSVDEEDAVATWYGPNNGYDLNRVVSDVDLNGDGADEILYGHTYASNSSLGSSGLYAGVIYLIEGSGASGSTPVSDLDNGWRGASYYELLGSSMGGQDLDADGYGDLVGCGLYSRRTGVNAGSCYLVMGDKDLPGFETVTDVAQASIGGQVSERLGTTGRVLFGDFDSDGKADLVLGSSVVGEALVFFDVGSLSGEFDTGDADVTIRTRGGPANFGTGLAVGDLDGDGVDDLAVGAPDSLNYQGSGADEPGMVYRFTGGTLAAATTGLDERDASGSVSGLTTADGFGWTLLAVDMDSNGVDDLVVGAPSDSSRRGRVSFLLFE